MLPRWTIWIFWMGVGMLVLGGLLFPTISCGPASPENSSAKNDIVQIVTALKNFQMEYGRYPRVSENGLCETAKANAQLMRILCAFDTTENPREIRFLEVPKAHKKRGVFRSGIDPNDGAWNDPWGNFYRIRIAMGSAQFRSPYLDGNKLSNHGIAWSVGKDGVQGNRRDPTSMNGSDDIHSWR